MGPSATDLAINHWNTTPLYSSEQERYGIYPWLYEAAEFRHHRGERVLEIGCGTGCDLLQFAKHGAIATGVDITPKHLELARQRVGDLASVLEADGEKLPFSNASFDYVYSHGVLMHTERPRRIVNEIFRVLRTGGRFNVHVYSLISYFTLWRLLLHGTDWKLWLENSRDPVRVDLYTGRSLRKLFAPAELSLVKHQCKPWERLAPMLGWFLVATGQKPGFTQQGVAAPFPHCNTSHTLDRGWRADEGQILIEQGRMHFDLTANAGRTPYSTPCVSPQA